jgi:hypothetical protein
MSSVVFDQPVAPTRWVHETRTVGTGLSAAGTDLNAPDAAAPLPPVSLLLHSGWIWRETQTSSFHLAAECSYFHNYEASALTPWRLSLDPPVSITPTETSTDVRALPPTQATSTSSPVSAALQAADDLRAWLHLTYEDVASMSGLGKRSIHHWRATGAIPRPATVRRLLEIHALVQVLRRRLGPTQANDWFRSGMPSRLELLRNGDLDAVRTAAQEILFPRLRHPVNPSMQSRDDTQEILAHIEQQYILNDRAIVLDFLSDHPNTVPIVHGISMLIPAYFPDAPLHLRVLPAAPTGDSPDGRRLLLFIATDLGEEQAMQHMDRLMDAWHADARSRPAAPFSVGVALGAADLAVDQAAEQFVQTHGAIRHKEYRELAQRLLDSEPGTLEEAIARAEYLASLAADQGIQLPTSGGDALMVLARLRRQAGKRQ